MGGGYTNLRQQAIAIARAGGLRAGYTISSVWMQTFADPLTPTKLRAGEPVNYCVGCRACMKLMLGQYSAGCAVYDPHYRALFKEYRRAKANEA
jgi:hypothetical protein